MRKSRALALIPVLCLLGLLFSANAQASGGTAEGWGLDRFGQLGDGTTGEGACECIEAPVTVRQLVSGVTQIAAGGEHTLALLADGTVMAWGVNTEGELGNGESSGPGDCGAAPFLIPCSTVPIRVPGLANVVAIAAGAEYSLALLADGTVMSWGSNFRGELGDGTTSGPDCTNHCRATPARVPGLANVVAIAAAEGDGLALLANGTVMAWGGDRNGETGDGTGTRGGCECVDEPTPVTGVSGAMAISAGAFGGLALLGDGTVKAWGENEDGELGNGTTTPLGGCNCLGPVSVSGLAGAQALAAGGFHSLAIGSGGSAQSWGGNSFGELGHDVSNSCNCSPTPAPVVALSGPTAIAAGEFHSLALLPNGAVRAWGFNNKGQLGLGTTKDREVPTVLSGVSGASGVSASEEDSFALIGPSQTLKIALAGAGSGAVGGPGILCPSGCEAHYPQGQVENLRAEPKPGSGFAGFSGPCTGTATTCQVRLDQDQTLTATFGPPKDTKITKATVISRKKSASFSFTAPGAITGFECMLVRPKPHKAHRKHQRHTQPKPRFSGCSSSIIYKHLTPGHYAFQVRALDILGADAHPALKRFTIKSHKAKKARGHR